MFLLTCLFTYFRFRSINGGESLWDTMAVKPQNSTRFTLYNLEPDTTYEFMVSSRNQFGDGISSTKVHGKTLGLYNNFDQLNQVIQIDWCSVNALHKPFVYR